jgi:hypothetical protein
MERAGVNGLCADCFTGCPATNLESKTGDKVASGTLPAGQEQMVTACGPELGRVASAHWVAPQTGMFNFAVGGGAYVAIMQGDCAGNALACWTPGGATVSLSMGQEVALLIARSDTVGGSYTLGINQVTIRNCDAAFCPSGPSMEPACCTSDDACGLFGPMGCVTPTRVVDAGSSAAVTRACIASASSRGDVLCQESSLCSCNACPALYDICARTDGCRAVLHCMQTSGCIDQACQQPEACGAIIRQFDGDGGNGNVAYLAATGLADCDRSASCRLACDAAQGTGGVPSARGGTDSGGRSGAGGSGGSGNAIPIAAADPTKRAVATSGGCGCAVPRGRESGWGALVLLTCLGVATNRRRKRAHRHD